VAPLEGCVWINDLGWCAYRLTGMSGGVLLPRPMRGHAPFVSVAGFSLRREARYPSVGGARFLVRINGRINVNYTFLLPRSWSSCLDSGPASTHSIHPIID
jgi:hypothetical protein